MALPLYAIWRGQRVRVLYRSSRSSFMVLDHRDDRRLVPEASLTFLPN